MSETKTFFDHQDQARKRSRMAITGFALTVILVVVCVSVFAGYVYFQVQTNSSGSSSYSYSSPASAYSRSELYTVCLTAGGVTLAVVLISWAIRILSLSAGPAAVMKSIGGWRVPPDSKEPDQRRLLNLVEEMSIASGVPVPDVYIMDSTAINACAAGLETDKAAIAVTRGAIVGLNRDELQGVIAHEYSHILNGDMALNTQMIAWLAGLFTVSELGRMAIHIGLSSGSSRRRSKDEGGGRIAIAGIGLVLWLLGAIGVFFGKILQARVSREREYLADASAVQYTRNPDGLANALRKLGNKSVRGRMVTPNTDCAHMMFSNLRSSNFSGLFSTHPALPDRIQRIQPQWDGSFLEAIELTHEPEPAVSQRKPKTPEIPGLQNPRASLVLLNLLEEQQVPNAERLQAAEAWKQTLPPRILHSSRDPVESRALVYHLLLADENEVPGFLTEQEEPAILDHLTLLREECPVNRRDRLSILDLTLPALRHMEPGEQESFLKMVDQLSALDGKIDLFEYALRRILHNTLVDPKGKAPSRSRLHIRKAADSVNVMLSILSRLGAENDEEALAAFTKAKDRMFGYTAGVELTLLPSDQCGLNAMNKACDQLEELAPTFQQRVLLAGLAAVTADDQLDTHELEAFRAFAAAMRIPVPPALGFGDMG